MVGGRGCAFADSCGFCIGSRLHCTSFSWCGSSCARTTGCCFGGVRTRTSSASRGTGYLFILAAKLLKALFAWLFLRRNTLFHNTDNVTLAHVDFEHAKYFLRRHFLLLFVSA